MHLSAGITEKMDGEVTILHHCGRTGHRKVVRLLRLSVTMMVVELIFLYCTGKQICNGLVLQLAMDSMSAGLGQMKDGALRTWDTVICWLQVL